MPYEPVFNPSVKPWYRKRWLLSGVVLGALYGFLLRFAFGTKLLIPPSAGWVMTVAFLGLCPAVIGYVTISEAEARGRTSPVSWILAPWAPTLIACLLAIACRIEGMICLIFAIPITLVASSTGGIVAGLDGRHRAAASRSTLACLGLLPFVLAPLETWLGAPTQVRTVASAIRIHAPVDAVWHNIERVPPITASELHSTWAQRIGFPRPVEATLSYEGIGGVRHASFERGLMFVETVTAWQPNDRLAFGIKADRAHLPPTTLDEHVTIGGRYFDVLDGEYRIEPLPNGDVLLHLTSHQRLTTDFNSYAGLWSDAVMQNLQTSILQVIQHRCEQQAALASNKLQ